MLILYTGANTSFNGFPNLASFVAEDAFLPRRLTRRGHRLVFSNGIIILTIAAEALLIGTKAQVNVLVGVYRSVSSPASPWRAPAWPSTTCAYARRGGDTSSSSMGSRPCCRSASC